ncbi:MAG: hypothetical protein FWF24_03200 [Alphaproteobacteria bacterium]|nr:hypothetical protein [Alphaproteobacteria bacterium]
MNEPNKKEQLAIDFIVARHAFHQASKALRDGINKTLRHHEVAVRKAVLDSKENTLYKVFREKQGDFDADGTYVAITATKTAVETRLEVRRVSLEENLQKAPRSVKTLLDYNLRNPKHPITVTDFATFKPAPWHTLPFLAGDKARCMLSIKSDPENISTDRLFKESAALCQEVRGLRQDVAYFQSTTCDLYSEYEEKQETARNLLSLAVTQILMAPSENKVFLQNLPDDARKILDKPARDISFCKSQLEKADRALVNKTGKRPRYVVLHL